MCFDQDNPGTDMSTALAKMPAHHTFESSPGKQHGYFLLQEGAVLPNELKARQDQIAELFKSDTAVNKSTQLMRMPYFFHAKKGQTSTPMHLVAPSKTSPVDPELPPYSREALDEILGPLTEKDLEKPATAPSDYLDSTEINGPRGRFNRRYTMDEAIDEYLPEVFELASGTENYSYVHGTTNSFQPYKESVNWFVNRGNHAPVPGAIDAYQAVVVHRYLLPPESLEHTTLDEHWKPRTALGRSQNSQLSLLRMSELQRTAEFKEAERRLWDDEPWLLDADEWEIDRATEGMTALEAESGTTKSLTHTKVVNLPNDHHNTIVDAFRDEHPPFVYYDHGGSAGFYEWVDNKWLNVEDMYSRVNKFMRRCVYPRGSQGVLTHLAPTNRLIKELLALLESGDSDYRITSPAPYDRKFRRLLSTHNKFFFNDGFYQHTADEYHTQGFHPYVVDHFVINPPEIEGHLFDPSKDYSSECPRTIEALLHVLEGNEELLELLRMAIAVTLSPPENLKHMFILLGPPHTLKSTLMNIAASGVLGGMPSIPLQSFGEQFGLQKATEARAIYIPEITPIGDGRPSSKEERIAVARIKSITGDDGDLQVDVKNREPTTISRKPILWGAGNTMPNLPDPGGALAARYVPIHLSNPVKPDPRAAEEMLKERSAFLMWAMGGLEIFYGKYGGVFPTTEVGIKDILEDRAVTCSVTQWVLDRGLTTSGSMGHTMTAAELHKDYRDWCHLNSHRRGLREFTSRTFPRAFEDVLSIMDPDSDWRSTNRADGRKKKGSNGVRYAGLRFDKPPNGLREVAKDISDLDFMSS